MSNRDYNMLTQARLKELLRYDPETGIFTRIIKNKRWDTVGTVAASKYNNNKYIAIHVDKKIYRAHRLAWLYIYGEFPPDEIDHIDGDGLNNKWDNLRSVTRVENQRNMKRSVRNKSGCTGVHWLGKYKKWQGTITVHTKQVHLGVYDEYWNAVCARKSAESKYNFHPNHGRA